MQASYHPTGIYDKQHMTLIEDVCKITIDQVIQSAQHRFVDFADHRPVTGGY